MIESLSEKFLDELLPGERIVWSGQPKQGFVLRSSDLLMIPVSLLWAGFAFSWENGVVADGRSLFGMLWGIPFIVIGLYFLVGRFFVDMIQRRKVYYALTDERVIIISGITIRNTKILELKNIPEVNLSAKRNGKGTITFGVLPPNAWMYTGNFSFNSSKTYMPPNFEIINDVNVVYQHITNLRK